MKKKLLTIALIAVFAAAIGRPANAQFGLSIVYDPTNYANAVLRYSQLIAQLNQLRATYFQILNQYNLALQMSHNLPNMASRYATSWAPWRYASAQDAYGNATPWINGVNSGSVPAVIRANAVATNNTIGNIQSDSLSASPNLNTEVSVLNKVNATNVLSLQNAQDTNKLLVAILEQQTILSKQLRDASTNFTNADISRRTNSVTLNQQLSGGIGQTLNSYQLP